MSDRVSGASGRFGGGVEYSASRTELGSKNSRCVSKNPTEKNQGWAASRSSSIAIGATSWTWFESSLTTRSYPIASGSFDMCCSPIRTDV